MDSKILTKPKIRNIEKLSEPGDYQVILLNDDFTTMDFVVEVLTVIFRKNIEEANKIMLDVHNRGRGLVGRYSWDIAVTKTDQVHAAARENQFPLRCIVEAV